MKSSLGIVLPVCNVEATLRRNVQYLLEIIPDLVSRFELMIVDDGSTDQTDEIAQELAREYPQIRVLRQQQPQGLAAAVQKALPLLASDAVYVHQADQPLQSEAVQQALHDAGPSAALPRRWTTWQRAMQASAEQPAESAGLKTAPSAPRSRNIRRAVRS